MNIAICDDEPVQLKHIESLVFKWSMHSKEEVHISLYENAQTLLFHYTPGFFDVFLLDIQMEGENGISLAKKSAAVRTLPLLSLLQLYLIMCLTVMTWVLFNIC